MRTRRGGRIALATGIVLAMAACGGANGSGGDPDGKPEGVTLLDLGGFDVAGSGDAATDDAALDLADPGVAADTPPVHFDLGPEPDLPPATFDLQYPDVPPEDVPSVPDVPVATDDGPAEPGLATKGYLYPHTSDKLYRWAPGQVPELVGTFTGLGGGQMTDLAIDYDGRMYGVTFDAFYQCNAQTAACQKLADMDEQFNGLTLVPAGTVDVSEALIAISNAGGWYKVTFAGGKATLTKLGDYGSGYTSAGDAYSITGVGTFAAVVGNQLTGTTLLVTVDPKTGKASNPKTIQGATDVYGLAGVGATAYAFSETGYAYKVEPGTGKTVVALTGSIPWWGAAVSTRGK